MRSDRVLSRCATHVSTHRVSVLLLAVGVSASLLPLAGCSGCRKNQPTAVSKETAGKKAKKKPDYEIKRLEIVPSDDALARNYVKPGHVATASLSAVCNVADLHAEVESQVTDVNSTPVRMGGTNYHLLMSRPAALPKGQRKSLEFTFFIPPEPGLNTTLFLRHTLRTARGGHLVHAESEGTRQMPAYQYLLVVLSANPNAFGYLKQLDTVRPIFDETTLEVGGEVVYFRVVLPKIEDRIPLPTHSFAWSPIAYVLWDGQLADRMTDEQRRGMLDWLHWGGQLIINGPNSLDRLAGTFLEPYLPATAGGAVELKEDAFQPLNEYWSLPRAKTRSRATLDVLSTSPLVGVRLQPQEGAAELVGSGQLVCERRVGRGRVVVTAFSLSAPEVVNWHSFDSFVNNGLLRRPRRVFQANEYGSAQTRWVELPTRPLDPLLSTATRYFTRDMGHLPAGADTPVDPAADWHVDGCDGSASRAGGLGSWNDASGVAAEAHRALQEAAGISIPKASFVLTVLVVYLVVLVPVNWALFRLLNRVEWAWAAAPVIAIIGAVAVIRLAQLDIGFVRSRTEIAVAEMHSGYGDLHVTRYTALYSSLSTSYQYQFEDPSGVARPFPPTPSPDRLWPVTYRREDGVHLSGFQVDSNTTSFIHSEHMCELGGTIKLVGRTVDAWAVENGTALNLRHVQLLYGGPSGVECYQWEELPAGSVARVSQAQTASGAGAGAPAAAPGGSELGVNLHGVARIAAEGLVLRPGDARLVAWSDDALPGLTIQPSASQARVGTLVLVHLRYGPLPPPRPDANLRVDIQEKRERPDEGDPSQGLKLEDPAGRESP